MCAKCPSLRIEWSEASHKLNKAVVQYGPFADETNLAFREEKRARQRWVAHSVRCLVASTELMDVLSMERAKRESLTR
jgi:hypothetical protein